jgi:PAS domain S-box-containing protein/putative nucleotidyltransferase with HDIG domain
MFDDQARGLLVEMALDISFALDNFAREAERKRAEDALSVAEEQFRGLVEQSIAGIFIIQDGRFAYVNPRFADILGYDEPATLIGTDPSAMLVAPDTVTDDLRGLLAGEGPAGGHIVTAVRKDGTLVDLGLHGARASHAGRPAIIGLMQDISEKKRAEEQVRHYLGQLEIAFMDTVQVATKLSELRDPYTAGHERRVARIASAIARDLGWDDSRVKGVAVAGYLHDLGKITIPAEILTRPGALSEIERMMIRGHPQTSHDVLRGAAFPWPVAEIVLQHHERLDGSGYPRGLKGDEILPDARILAVADVVEAMASHRPYRPGLGIDRALAEIEDGCGKIYDPEVAESCLRLFREKGFTVLESVG